MHREETTQKRFALQSISALALLCFAVSGWEHDIAYDANAPLLHAPEFTPTPVPDRIILTWTGDPSRSQAVTWRTSADVKEGIGEIALAGEGPLFVDQARKVQAKTVCLDADLGSAAYHTVEFEGLKPKTKYAFRVGNGEVFSEWSHFTTASDWAEPFTFVYVGDAQTHIKSLWSRVIRSAFVDAPKMAFVVYAGDLVNRGYSDAEWGQWFYAGSFLHRMIPCVATPGNHEYARRNEKDERTLTDLWRPMFAYPQTGPAGLEETVYYIDYQGARIISLNSCERQEEQVPWLEKVPRQKNLWAVSGSGNAPRL